MLYAKTLACKLSPDLKANLIQSTSELWGWGSKSYVFMENDKNHFTHKPVSTFTICRNFIWIKNWICITIFSEKFPNQCKEQTNNKVSSNILPLYKTSSWIWQSSLCKKQIMLTYYFLFYHSLLFPIQARPIFELQVCSYCLNISQGWLNVALTM